VDGRRHAPVARVLPDHRRVAVEVPALEDRVRRRLGRRRRGRGGMRRVGRSRRVIRRDVRRRGRCGRLGRLGRSGCGRRRRSGRGGRVRGHLESRGRRRLRCRFGGCGRLVGERRPWRRTHDHQAEEDRQDRAGQAAMGLGSSLHRRSLPNRRGAARPPRRYRPLHLGTGPWARPLRAPFKSLAA